MANEVKHKQNGLYIHSEDGRLYPGFPGVATLPEYRPYHGDPKATLKERMRYLQGFQADEQRAIAAEKGEFNVLKATKEQLLEHMLDEYGERLDARKDLAALQVDAFQIMQRVEGAISEATKPRPVLGPPGKQTAT
jgi:hypothetical protein